MARPWSEVQNSPVYQQLPAEKQAAAKRQYFNNVVAPRVPEDRREKAWAQFDGAAPQAKAEAPGLLSRISSALPERPDLAPHDPQARYWFVDDPEADRKMKETPQQRATPPDPLAAGSRDALLRGDGPRTLRADAAVQAGADAFTVPDDGTLLSLPSTKALVRREGERAKLDATRGANLEALRREAISTRRLEGADADQWAQEEYERRYQAGDSKALKPAEADWSTTFGLGATRAGRGLARGFYGTMEALGDVFGGDELSRYNAEDAARQEAAIAKAVRDAAGAVPAEGFKSIVADALPTVISQSAPIAAAALTAVVTRNPAAVRPFLDAAVLTPMGVQKFGENYRDAKAKGLATEDRVGYALGGALAEVLPERLSLGVLLDVLAKPVAKGGKAAAQKGVARELAERFLMAQGTELATEEVTTVADFILEQHYLNPDLSLKELQDRMMRTALVTPVATTALMGPGATGSVTGSALRNGVSPQARALRELRDTVDGAQFVRGADRAAADLLSPESAQYREIARQEPMSLDAMADRAGVAVSQQAAPQAISSAALATAARTPAAAPSAPAAATAPAAVAGAGAGEALPASLLEDDDAALLQAPSARPSQATAGARGPEGATRGMAAGAQTVSRQDFNVGGKDPHTVSFEHKKDGRLIRTITYPDGEVLSETLAEDRNGNESWVSERAYDQGEFYPRQLSSEEASAAIKDDIGGKAVISAQQPNQAPTALDISPGAITPKPEVLRPQFTHVPGNTGIAATERGIEVPFQYALVEADTLRTSQLDDLSPNPNYPQELQPRDRTRAGSEMQIARMAADIKPRRLGEAPMVSEGAPVIGPDAVVESGNGRTIALRRAYAAGKAKGYYDWLEENADYFGLDPMLVARMRAPVLVRVRTAPVDRLEFVRQANESALLVMSPVEQARADAARIDSMDDLTPTEDGDFAGSRDFIRRFIGRLPATEQAGMIDAAGRLSQAGYARVRNAVLARAYGDSPVMTRLVESMDDNLRNIGKALMSVAPAVAKARTDIVDGALFDADLTPDLIAAVETLSRIKEEGRSIAEELAQLGLLDEGLSMEARELLAFLADNVRRPRKIAEFILRYTEALRAAGNPNQGSLLGEAQAPTKAELLAAARGRTNEAATEQQPAAARQPAAATQSGRTGPAEPAAENRVKPAAEGGSRRGTQGDEGRQVTPQPATASIETPANAGVSASDLLNPKNGKPFSSITIANQVRKKQADPNAWGVYRRGDAFVLRRWDADTGREADPNWYDQKRAQAEAVRRAQAVPVEPLLQSYTEAEIAAQEAEQREREAAEARAEREAAERDRQARERAEVRARSEAAAQTFELGMDPLQNLTGQGGLFGQAEPEAAPQPATPAASANTIFTEDAAEKARALLRRKLGQLNSGIDPEMLQAGITLAGYHIEKGARTFAAYARAMLGDLGEAVRPYLKSWYMGVKYDPRATGFDGMDSAAAVEAADENADFIGMEQQEQGNGTDKRSSSSVEPDRRNAATQDGLGAEGVRAGPGGDAAGGGRGVRGAQGDGGARRGGELPGRETPPAGKPGDLTVYTGATDVPGSVARSELDRRSARPGIDGAPVEPDAATAIAAAARGGSRLAETKAAQAKADAAPHGARLEDIRAALPALLPGQQEDVFKAEQRFAKPNGYGMLFTNGTGTGKTFTGLGIIKRFALAGKTNILIVAPKDKIIEDWQRSGRVLGLDIGRLQDTQDAGDGVVITTYANFGDNAALASRDWDLVALDEAHYLLQDKDGTPTSYLHALRAITMHPDGVHRRHEMLNGKEIAERNRLAADAKMLRMSDDERQWVQAEKVQDKADMLTRRLDEKLQAIRAEVDGRQGAARPRAVFLSATPFAYEKTIDWANGYLFDYNDGQPSEKGAFRGYNQGSNRDRFFVRHLGYRMRNNKLTQPDAKVDSGLMQRQFNAWLKREGSLSGRMLDVAFDYDRRFILVDSAIGTRIDAALAWFKERTDEYSAANPGTTGLAAALSGKGDPYVRALSAARNQISDKFDYLSRRYLLESIKAREVVPHIREHLALGRKVVVFHDYKKGGGFNPFVLEARSTKEGDADARAFLEQWNKVVREFSTEFADIINSDLFRQSSPIEMFQKEFPDVLLINGNVSDAQRRKNVAKFQDDASGPQVILVQSEAGKEGISLHDTTGKHQRVLFNLGQPTQPTTAIQQEGRIYRTGQQSHAIFRYLNTGTQWEKWAFATTIAQRASTAENLGAGEQARALKDAFIQAFEESDSYRAGMEGEGTGGKARDRLANEALTEYDRARTFYFGQQKKTSSTKAQEGTDYFATPEPVGLKMVEWADIRPGERALEPSAGHGAIARWIPETAERTAIEPSSMLLPRLAMVFDGKIVDGDFESLHVNNKFDAIVMNPPFGTGGKTAIEHLAKAATHLREKGRIVALIPTGPAADKRFEKWFYETEERPVRPIAQIDFGTGPIAIYRGDTVRSRASWAPEAIVTRKADSGALWVKVAGRSGETQITVESLTGHTNTGPRTEAFRPADGLHLIADIQMPGVTFERAGTRVATRIVVIEKQSDPAVAQALASSRQDLSGIEDIGKLFDRLQDMSLPPRAGVIDADADPATRLDPTTPAEPGRVVSDGEAATVERIEGGKLVTDAPEVEHVTQKGKRLKGVIVRSLTKEEAQQADGYTFKKDGGYFVRMAHVTRPPMMSRSASPAAGPAMTRADVAAAVAAQLPSLARSVEAALRRGDEGKAGGVVVIERAEGLARVFAGKTGRTLDAALQQLGTNGNGDIQGLYDPRSGLTFLVGAALTPETAPAVLLHEATHAKPRADIDARTLALIESRDKAAFKRVREFLRRVAQRMEDAGETGNAAEATAYVVEQAVIEGRQAGFSAVDGRLMSWIGTKLGKRVGDIVRDFVAMVRAWALRAGVKLDPSVDDLVALARMNVRAMGRGNVVRTGSTVSGSREDAADVAAREFRETERAYGGREAYERAKAAGRTKLNYRQWVQVRTPAFKAWFGDWETAGAGMQRTASTFAEAREHARSFQGKPMTNGATGIVATVSRNNLDKMLSGKAVGKSESPAAHSMAVANLDRLFQRAVLGWSKPDSKGDPNIKAIHRFFTPVMIDGRAMLAKMTVKETGLAGDPNPLYTVETISFEEMESPAAQWVAEIAGADGVDPKTIRSAGLIESMAQRVQEFNPASTSKVVDSETGEPMVVYHGTDANFSAFDPGMIGKNDSGWYGRGFYFTPRTSWTFAEDSAFTNGGDPSVMPVFLKIDSPMYGYADAERGSDLVGSARDRGGDGVIVRYDPGHESEYEIAEMVVFAPGQIKSATGNRGTFDPANADIRMSRAQRPATEQQSSELESPEAGPGAIARGLGRIAQGLSVVAGAVDAPVDAALRRAFKGTGAAALIRTAGETAGAALSALTPEVIKAGVISDYGLDVSAIDRRDQMYSQMRRELRKAGDTIGLLQNLTLDERKIAYNWMTGEDYGGNFDALPTASKSLLRDVQAQIDELSREAIRLGQLSAEAYERNKMAYLHRSYRKYDLAQTEAERSGSARSVAIRGEQYRGRGMSREVPMSHIQNGAPEWWGRKTQAGKADKQLKGEKFIKLERRAVPTETLTSRQFKNGSLRVRIDSESRPVDEATLPLEQMQGPGNTNPQQKGRLLAVQYWPASVPLPAMYQEWDNAGTWEVRNTRGDKLILWRDFTKEERQRLGEIEDAPYAVAKTLHQMIHDIEVGRYLEYLANNFAMPEAQLPPDARLAEAKEGLHRAFERDEWVLVPQTKVLGTQALKYGKLAGLYVPGPIWNDIRQTVNTKSFMPGWYATILRMWKISKTALSPAVHTNNVMSNLVMADWHDVRPQHIRKAIDVYLDPGIEEHAGLLRAFEESGGMTGMWALTELQREQIEPIVEQLRREAAPAAEAQNMMGVLSALSLIGRLRFADAYAAAAESLPGRGVKTAGRAMIDLYQSEDQLFRLAAFIKAKQNGAPDLEAGRAAKNSFLNYQINAPWIQAMRQTAFPFISFTYRAVPMVLEVAKNRPWKLAKLALYASALNMLAYAIAGGDEEKERALLPEEKAGRMFFGNPKLVRMPWNDANDSPVFLDVRRWVPVGDFFDTGANHAAIPLLPFMVPGGPLALMSELLANKSQFTGREIVLETDTPSEKAAKVIDHLYKAFAPNILVLPGTYAYTGVMNAGGGKTDAFGREQSVALAVASSFGVKLGAYPKDVLAQQAVARHQGRVLEIDRQARAADRELARKGITIKEWTERRKQLDEKKLKEGKALAERMKAAN